MILNLLLLLVYGFLLLLTYPLSAFSDVTAGGSLSQASSFLGNLSHIIPKTMIVFFSDIGLLLVFFGAVIVYKAVMWLIKKIPTIN